MNKDDFKEAIKEALEERAPVDQETHIKHHDYIDKMIEEAEERIERNKKIKQAVYIWGTLGILSYVATVLHDKWEEIMHVLFSGGN